MVLGVTGFFCSGKSAAAEFFRSAGFKVVDVDRLGHEVLREKAVIRRLTKTFGSGILSDCGIVDRKKLGGLVFRNAAALSKLNRLVHPVMVRKVRALIRKEKRKNILIDAALLYQMKLDRLCDRVLYIHADRAVIIKRAKQGRGVSTSAVADILRLQAPLRIGRRSADDVILNNGKKGEFKRKLEEYMLKV